MRAKKLRMISLELGKLPAQAVIKPAPRRVRVIEVAKGIQNIRRVVDERAASRFVEGF